MRASTHTTGAHLLLLLGLFAVRAEDLCGSEICHCDGASGKVTCSCHGNEQQELVLDETSVPVTTAWLHVERCSRITVEADAVSALPRLHRVDLAHIADLRLEERALYRNVSAIGDFPAPRLFVCIERCNVSGIDGFAFSGRMEDIILRGSHIAHVAPFSFASLDNTERLEISNCTIEKLEGKAFKRFSVDTLIISGGRIEGELNSYTFSDISVMREVHINTVAMDHVRSLAFDIKGSRVFTLRGCNINRTYGEAFKVIVRGPVEIRDNTFTTLDAGAFAGFAVDRYSLKHGDIRRITFQKNTIKHLVKGSLWFNRTGLEVVFKHVLIDQECSCTAAELWISYMQKNAPFYSPRSGISSTSSSSAADALLCINKNSKQAVTTLKDYEMLYCSILPSGLNLFLIIIIPICILFLIIGICIFLIFRKRAKDRKHWVSVPTSNEAKGNGDKMSSKETLKTPDGKLKLVVPDGRTYRETELHVIVERAEPLTETYVPPVTDTK